MKALFKIYPKASRFVLALILFALVLFISGLTNKGFIKQYIPYVSCVLLFFVTWLLYKTEGKSLTSIGLNFNLKNLSFLPLGISIGMIALFGATYLKVFHNEKYVSINQLHND